MSSNTRTMATFIMGAAAACMAVREGARAFVAPNVVVPEEFAVSAPALRGATVEPLTSSGSMPITALCVAVVGATAVKMTSRRRGTQSNAGSRTARQAAVWEQINNPVRTVSQTIAEFYKEYPAPPVLPMYRTFIVDLLTQSHLISVDRRFKYDAVFALGLWHYFSGLMQTYDKLVMSAEKDKIWAAMIKALGLNPEQVKSDAEAVVAYAGATPPAQILTHLEGSAAPSEARVAAAFSGISSGLVSSSFSIGLFRVMELSGVETSKANVEEWAKALKITPARMSSDLETYKQNQVKLQKAEEMIREIEIREKKKLAERLEQKAKALAAKAAAKAEEAKE